MQSQYEYNVLEYVLTLLAVCLLGFLFACLLFVSLKECVCVYVCEREDFVQIPRAHYQKNTKHFIELLVFFLLVVEKDG